jgi:hypothetical protein
MEDWRIEQVTALYSAFLLPSSVTSPIHVCFLLTSRCGLVVSAPAGYSGGPGTEYVIAVAHKKQKKTPWPESASELYRPSDRRLSVKLVPTFADRETLRSKRGGSPTAVISVF